MAIEQNPPENKQNQPTPVRLVMMVAATMLVAETVIMVIQHFFPGNSSWVWTVLDSLMLTLIVLPVLYFWVYQPMNLHIRERIQSEERYSSLFHKNHAVILLIEQDSGKIVDANGAACEFYGYSK